MNEIDSLTRNEVALTESDEEYALYSEYMEWSSEFEETLERSIVEMKRKTEELVLWRENLLSAGEQRIQKTQELILHAEEWKKENLKGMKERSELEWTHLQEGVKKSQNQEKDLEKAIEEKKKFLENEKVLLAAEVLKSQQLQSALSLKRGN